MLRSLWQRLPDVWYVRGLVVVLGVLCLLGPVTWGLVLLTERERERECLAAGSDWLWGDCVQVYEECEVAGARYPLGTTYSDGCNVCRCVRHGLRCTSKYCSKYTPEQRVLEIGNGRSER